ncbi:chemotaxis protein MotA [Nitrosospira briensis]|nr:chemotaxis protein MotA [Nitrosospira briensis]
MRCRSSSDEDVSENMLIIIGSLVVLGSVFGGFALAGGHLGALFQPLELLIIGGAALGAFVMGNTAKAQKATLMALPKIMARPKYTKAVYMDLMALLYDLLARARKEGLMSIEIDVDNPYESAIFANYPNILADHQVVEFMTDYLRLMVGGNLNAFELENLMDNEIETHHQEGEIPVHCISKMADSMPAFGIVAAVMGVVHTMASVGLPPSQLGELIAQALVGTFLGILLGYGLVGPLAAVLEQKLGESTKMLQCIRVTLLSSINGYAPGLAVEFGRKVLYSTERPSFTELEDCVRQARNR